MATCSACLCVIHAANQENHLPAFDAWEHIADSSKMTVDESMLVAAEPAEPCDLLDLGDNGLVVDT